MIRPKLVLCMLATAAFLAFSSAPASAAMINYGDFTGATVVYEDVSEDDATPNFGAPVSPLVGDLLAFTPATGQFIATADGPDAFISDSAVGSLEFYVSSIGNGNISTIFIDEGGDYEFDGFAGSEGRVKASITVLVFDPNNLASPIYTTSAVFQEDFTGPDSVTDFWDLQLLADISAFELDEVYVVVNNNLTAIKTNAASDFIQKKYFSVDTTLVPEPGTLALLGLGFLVMRKTRRLSA